MTNTSVLSMDPTDIVFMVTVGGKQKQVSALMEAYASWNSVWDELTVDMNVKELFCDGQSYSLTDNRIIYYIDNAHKPAE